MVTYENCTPVDQGDYTEVVVPANTGNARITVGSGETLEGLRVDLSASNNRIKFVASGTGWTLRNIAVDGLSDYHDPTGIKTFGLIAHGECLMENIYVGDGSQYYDGPGSSNGAMWLSPDSTGHLVLRRIYARNWKDNAYYLSSARNCEIDFYDSFAANSNHANFRVGSEDAHIERCSSVYTRNVFGGRAVWGWDDGSGPTDIWVNNCNIVGGPEWAFWAGEKSYPDAVIHVNNTDWSGTVVDSLGTVSFESGNTTNPDPNWVPPGCPTTPEAAYLGQDAGGGARSTRPSAGSKPTLGDGPAVAPIRWDTQADWEAGTSSFVDPHTESLSFGYGVTDLDSTEVFYNMAHYDTGGGVLYDDSGNDNDASANGSVAFGQSQPWSRRSIAVDDAGQGYLTISDADVTDPAISDELTILAVVRRHGAQQPHATILTHPAQYYFQIDGDEGHSVNTWTYESSGIGHGYYPTTATVPDNQWSVIAMTEGTDGERIVAIDGVTESFVTGTTLQGTSSSHLIGGEGGSLGRFFDGDIGYLALGLSKMTDGDLISLTTPTAQTGTWTSATKSFEHAVAPQFSNLVYDLNGETLRLTVVGSPNTAEEESHTLTLTGDTPKIPWTDTHTNIRITAEFEVSGFTASAVLSDVTLGSPPAVVSAATKSRSVSDGVTASVSVIHIPTTSDATYAVAGSDGRVGATATGILGGTFPPAALSDATEASGSGTATSTGTPPTNTATATSADISGGRTSRVTQPVQNTSVEQATNIGASSPRPSDVPASLSTGTTADGGGASVPRAAVAPAGESAIPTTVIGAGVASAEPTSGGEVLSADVTGTRIAPATEPTHTTTVPSATGTLRNSTAYGTIPATYKRTWYLDASVEREDGVSW